MNIKLLGAALWLAAVWAGNAAAQNTKAPQGFDAQQNLNALGNGDPTNNNVVRTFDTRYKGFINSPYFLEEWAKSDLFFANGTRYENIWLKLNSHFDEVVVRKRDTGDSIVVDKASVSHFVMKLPDSTQLIFKKLKGENDKPVFFQVLAQGKYTLLAKRGKSILRADYKGGYSAGRTHDEFLPFTHYYLQAQGQPLEKLKLGEKALLKLLGDADKSLAAYTKEQGLDLKKEADAAKLIGYVNQR